MAQKNPAFWLRLDRRHPDGNIIHRWASRPYADNPDSGGFKEGRILDFGAITRFLTDYTGNYRNSGFRCSLTDIDRFFRILLDTEMGKRIINSEIAVELLSDAARAASLSPRCVYRGVVNNHPFGKGLKTEIEGEDYIGSMFSPISLNRTIPFRTWNRRDWPDMHRDLVGTVQQIPYGEISDEGAEDEEGYNSEKGRHPVVWLGYEESSGYHVFGVAGCAIKSINQWYASDLSIDTPPDRVRQTEDTAGVDFLLPGWPGWPHPKNYIEKNGQRMTVIYAAGPVADHHIQGTVNITLNICGIEDKGDGSGEMIDTAFVMLQHLFEQWVIPNGGKGYQTGNWIDAPEWPGSGLSIVKSSTFAHAQDQTRSFLGDGRGYKTIFDLTQPESIRDIIRYACLSFNCYMGVDWDGRLMVKVLDDTPDPNVGMLLDERINTIEVSPPEFMYEECENKITYQYAWDNDKDVYAADLETIESLDSQGELGQVYEPQSPHPLRMVGHTATARDAMARRLLRLKYPPKYSRVVVDLCGLDMDLGDQFLLTAPAEGLGPEGYQRKPFFLMGNTLSPSTGRIELVGMDLETFTGKTVLTTVNDTNVEDSEIPEDGWEVR